MLYRQLVSREAVKGNAHVRCSEIGGRAADGSPRVRRPAECLTESRMVRGGAGVAIAEVSGRVFCVAAVSAGLCGLRRDDLLIG